MRDPAREPVTKSVLNDARAPMRMDKRLCVGHKRAVERKTTRLAAQQNNAARLGCINGDHECARCDK